MAGRLIQAAVAAMVATIVAAAPADAAVAGVTYSGDRAVHDVALTFDDGYDIVPCQQILDILVAERVPATFFPVGAAVAAHPAFWRGVDAAGFPIGDHSQTHPQMTRLTAAQQRSELTRSRATIEGVIGHPMTAVFRPPYGDANAQLVATARAAGYAAIVNWDTSDADTSGHGTDADHVAAGIKGQNGSIVLMHCGPAVTPRILPAIINSYRSRGFTFVTVPQMLGIRGPRPTFAEPRPAVTESPAPFASPAPRLAPSIVEQGSYPVASPGAPFTAVGATLPPARIPSAAAAPETEAGSTPAALAADVPPANPDTPAMAAIELLILAALATLLTAWLACAACALFRPHHRAARPFTSSGEPPASVARVSGARVAGVHAAGVHVTGVRVATVAAPEGQTER
jgi:peptidoglycan/xylan/chitin deacetylase (PgdA/CDA1 family)